MKYFNLFIFSFFVSLTCAQSDLENKEKDLSLSSIILPDLNTELLLKEDALENELKGKRYAPRFAQSIEVNINSNEKGNWYYEGETLIWELQLESKYAKSLSLIFDQFDIPDNSVVQILNNEDEIIQEFHQESSFKNKLSTPPFRSNSIIVRYKSSEGLKTELNISNIAQGYRDIFEKAKTFIKKDFGTSGSCNNNVACPEGDPWENQINSVAITILGSGTRWCSGCIIGNTRKDSTPYYLTAFHCVDQNDNGVISATELADIATWTFHFNYQSADCSPSVDGDLSQSISGSSLVASYFNSDMALLELSTTPPDSYNVYYAGWDRNNTPTNSAVGIHHPDGDVKKISIENDPIIDSPLDGVNRWRVPNWNDGITEPGSSGSPLFSEFGRVVGQLYGGVASCSNLSDGNPSNDFDEYGKFSTSWNAGTSNDQKLEPWLDPDGIGVTEIDGYYNFPVSVVTPTNNSNAFYIYPNPSSPDNVRIDLFAESTEDYGTINIYNIHGQMVHSQLIPNNIERYKIRTDKLSYGSYFVELQIGSDRFTSSLIIVSK